MKHQKKLKKSMKNKINICFVYYVLEKIKKPT